MDRFFFFLQLFPAGPCRVLPWLGKCSLWLRTPLGPRRRSLPALPSPCSGSSDNTIFLSRSKLQSLLLGTVRS